MQKLLSPLCLAGALICAICGFALLAAGNPEPGVELHQATASGDQAYQSKLEQQLKHRQRTRRVMIGGLFTTSVLLFVAAFMAMKDEAQRARS